MTRTASVPRLTIAIPTVNRATLLRRAIESALAQTSPDIEILVSDNASTDETPAVVAEYAARGVRAFRHDVQMTAQKHGDFLREQAQGEFFVGLSDDDFLEPDFAAEVLAMFDRHPELSFVYTGCAVHYGDVEVPAIVGPPIEPGREFLAEHYRGKREVSWCACASRTQLLLDIGPQPEDRWLGDMFYWTKLAFRGPVGCVPRVLSHYVLFRPQNDNMSHGTSPAVWAGEQQVLVDEVVAASRRAGAGPEYVSRLAADCRQHVARSTANQFVWTRIRGASIPSAWRWLPGCLRYLALNLKVVGRMAAALVLPRGVLRSALLRGAEKQAASRGTANQRS